MYRHHSDANSKSVTGTKLFKFCSQLHKCKATVETVEIYMVVDNNQYS